MSDLLDIDEGEVLNEKTGSAVLVLIKWWERKRITYNLLVGISGAAVFLLPIFAEDLRIFIPLGIMAAIYAFFANVFYTLGWILEVLLVVYFKKINGIGQYKYILFLIGTIFSMLLSLFLALFVLTALNTV